MKGFGGSNSNGTRFNLPPEPKFRIFVIIIISFFSNFSIFCGALPPYSLSTHIFPSPNFRKNSSISTRGETPAHLSMGVIPHVKTREFPVIGFS